MDQNTQGQTTTDMTFGKVTCYAPKTVRMQEISDRPASSWEMVRNCLLDMFEDENEFVVLTLQDIKENVRFVQAAQAESEIVVQLGMEEGDHTRLVEKECSEETCMEIFRKFYDTSQVDEIDAYQPVKFYV